MRRFIQNGAGAQADIVINKERLTATLDGDFVVFLIGMRINKPLLIHKGWPVAQVMARPRKSQGPTAGSTSPRHWPNPMRA